MLELSKARKEGSAKKGRVAEEGVTGTDRDLMMEHLMYHSKDLGFR